MKIYRLAVALLIITGLLSLAGGTGQRAAAQAISPPPLFVDNGLAPGTLYTYRILAHYSYGDSAYVSATRRTYTLEFYFPFILQKQASLELGIFLFLARIASIDLP